MNDVLWSHQESFDDPVCDMHRSKLANLGRGSNGGVGQPVQVAVVHPATGEHLAAQALPALAGRAGDSCI